MVVPPPPARPSLLQRLGRRLLGSDDPRPYLEVQYHPGDIRKRVRYYFLARRQVARLVVLAVAWVALLGFGLSVAPSVIADQLARRRYTALLAERERLGERLDGLVTSLADLDAESERVGNEMAKIYLAYGFDPGKLEGQGGFPFGENATGAPGLEAGFVAPQPSGGRGTLARRISIGAAKIGDALDRGLRYRASIAEELAVLGVFLAEVQSFEASNRDVVRTTPSVIPLRGDDFVLTSPFARRRNPFTKGMQFHAGVDLAAPQGTPIHATADGVVTFADWYSLRQSAGWWRYGRLVAIAHGDRFITLYGHCDELLVEAGQKVEQGQVIATVGNTGWSTSPHLHYEVRRRGDDGEHTPVDPRIYILDHRWRDEEKVLIRARSAPDPEDFEPLPGQMGR